jgi:cation transport ATPase
MFLLLADFKYYMRELLPLGAMKKAQLPVCLTSWVDKTSPLCMYTMIHTRTWSNAHLKAGCCYTDCRKVYCPLEEEEDVKKACVQADSKGAALNTNQDEEQEDEVEVDINRLPEKERNKIINQRKRDAKKAEDKAEKDAKKAKEKEKKEAKKGEKLGKSKPSTPPLLLTETSYASPSQNPHKQDASIAQLSLSRLQQITSSALMDSAGGALHIHEFFFS